MTQLEILLTTGPFKDFTSHERNDIIQAINGGNEYLINRNWNILKCSQEYACDLWIYTNDAELTFFNICTNEFAELRYCTPGFIAAVAEELGDDALSEFYSVELENARAELTGWAGY